MKHLIMATIALVLFGAMAGDGNAQGANQVGAQGLTRNALLGKWCTDIGVYNFTPAQLIVTFSNGGSRTLNIQSIDVQPTTIVVNWLEDSNRATAAERGKGSHTTFGKFSGNRMTQLSETYGDGQKSPERYFQRCN